MTSIFVICEMNYSERKAPMATFTVKISNIPSGVTERRIKELLSSKSKVLSLKMSRNSCTAQLESAALFSKLQQSTSGAMGFNSFVSMDSSGLGELKTSLVSLVR
jgi:RNA recognition motif-containing protein